MSIFLSRTPIALTLALLAAATASLAEPVQVKPGLWAEAVSTTVNGKPMPMPNLGNGPAAQQFQQYQQAMKQFGLPEGWPSSLSCGTKSAYDAQELLAKEKSASGCKFDVLDQRRDHVRFSMHCTSPQGESQGSGEVTITNGTEARIHTTSRVMVQGQAMNMEMQEISKWVGSDCKHPPAGIDPSWVQMEGAE